VVAETKPSQNTIGVAAVPAPGRQLFKFLDVPSPQYHTVWFEGGAQEGYYVRYRLAPVLLASPLQSANAHVILKGALLVPQMAQLHRLDNAVQNHGGTHAPSHAPAKQLSPPFAPHSLQGRIIHNLLQAPQ